MDFGLNQNSVVLLENLRPDYKLPVGTDVVWTVQKPYSSKLLGYILFFCYVAGEIAFMFVFPFILNHLVVDTCLCWISFWELFALLAKSVKFLFDSSAVLWLLSDGYYLLVVTRNPFGTTIKHGVIRPRIYWFRVYTTPYLGIWRFMIIKFCLI